MIKRKTIVLTAVVAIILFIAGFKFSEIIWQYAIPKPDGVFYTFSTIAGPFSFTLLIATVLATIPVAAVLTWHFAPIISLYRKLISIVIISAITTLAGIGRVLWVSRHAGRLIKDLNNSGLEYHVSFESLHLDITLLVGIVAGTVLSTVILKENLTRRKA